MSRKPHEGLSMGQIRVFRLLQRYGPLSRVELGELLGWNRPRVGATLTELSDVGLVEVSGHGTSRGGRPSDMARLDPGLRFIGVHAGVDSVQVAVTDGELRVVTTEHQPLRIPGTKGEGIDRLLSLVRAAADRADGPLLGVGVSVEGKTSSPLEPDLEARSPGRLAESLAAAVHCDVRADNAANAAALAEMHAGPARDVEDFIYVRLGRNVRSAVVLGGNVYRGDAGNAGDIGHLQVTDDGARCAGCGRAGCLTAYVGSDSLAREAVDAARSGRSPMLRKQLDAVGFITAADVGSAAAAGDQGSVELIRRGGQLLGEVVALMVSAASPQLVVLGGAAPALGAALLAEVRAVVYRRGASPTTQDLPIVVSRLGDDAGVIGAARLVSDAVVAPSRTLNARLS